MLAELWSRLPNELLCKVIQWTEDTATLQNWCDATISNRILHQVSLEARWSKVTISQNDYATLFCDNSNQQQWAARPASGLVETIISTFPGKDKSLHKCLASYIKYLILDFRFHKPASGENIPGLEGCHYSNIVPLPFFQDLVSTICPLLADLPQTSEIHHNGILLQSHLDQIVMGGIPVLKGLTLRWTRYGDLSYGTSYESAWNELELDWSNISQLMSLRTLRVQNLLMNEGASLGNAVKQMPWLEHLLVSAASTSHFALSASSRRRRISPLSSFLAMVFPSQPRDDQKYPEAMLPSQLKSLALIDSYGKYVHI